MYVEKSKVTYWVDLETLQVTKLKFRGVCESGNTDKNGNLRKS